MVIALLPSLILSLVLSIVLTVVLNLILNVMLIPAGLIGLCIFLGAMTLIRLLKPV